MKIKRAVVRACLSCGRVFQKTTSRDLRFCSEDCHHNVIPFGERIEIREIPKRRKRR